MAHLKASKCQRELNQNFKSLRRPHFFPKKSANQVCPLVQSTNVSNNCCHPLIFLQMSLRCPQTPKAWRATWGCRPGASPSCRSWGWTGAKALFSPFFHLFRLPGKDVLKGLKINSPCSWYQENRRIRTHHTFFFAVCTISLALFF